MLHVDIEKYVKILRLKCNFKIKVELNYRLKLNFSFPIYDQKCKVVLKD